MCPRCLDALRIQRPVKFGKGPVVGPYKEYRDAIVHALEQVVLKNTPPADALAEAEKSANEALKSYNDRVGG